MAEKIDQYLKNKKFQDIVLIAKKGKILFTKGYGLADTDLPNSPTTLRNIHCCSDHATRRKRTFKPR
ncbi:MULTISPECIES: hypothetical protein [Lysinibacillus]|uniref:hypothetical protein n=1 Tax=Lysinibacillus TaxID=400634 RepID=UPI002597AD67|nr:MULTISPECIES: hypothetical protein [Lysinibacillus]